MADSDSPTLLSADKTVTAAGTAEALTSAQNATAVTIVAKDNNTGFIYFGGSNVDSSTSRGLQAGDVINYSKRDGFFDLADLYIDASVSGEGVDFYAVKA